MTPFTQEKFQQLTTKRKHKHAARILRNIIEKKSSQEEYTIAAHSLNIPLVMTEEEMADRYHYHLEEAEIEPSESELLAVRHQDKNDAAAFLEIDIYLDNLRSAHNVGSIIRITEAFRLGEIYCGGHTPAHNKVKKSSMNAHKEVVIHPNKTIADLTKRPIIALETAYCAIPLNEFKFPDIFSLLLGNEEWGVSQEGLKAADYIVEIPLFGKKNSINVAAAFAIVANHIRNRGVVEI